MEKIIIKGGSRLFGTAQVEGAKNAVLPVIAATLMASTGVSRINNVPALADVYTIKDVLKHMNANVNLKDNQLTVNATNQLLTEAPLEYVTKMRASVLVLGPLLARYGHAKVAMPGGCAIGSRPIDLHLKGFEALGAKVHVGNGYVEAYTDKPLKGAKVYLDMPSVGATENIMMAAALAQGKSIIENAAKEPEIVDLANFLNKMGARVIGAGTETIKIYGVDSLKGAEHTVISDRIEAGTYMIAAAATDGNVLIKNVIPKHLESISAKLIECGVDVIENDDSVRVCSNGRPGKCNIKAMPYPGFPTDMQPQMTVLLSIADGTSFVSEGVWDNRFRYVEQLIRMGASIKVEGKMAVVEGVEQLKGAPVRADDLRAGAAMIIAGLVAKGTTEIEEISHIDRGYENIVEKLKGIGADIKRIRVPEPDELTKVV